MLYDNAVKGKIANVPRDRDAGAVATALCRRVSLRSALRCAGMLGGSAANHAPAQRGGYIGRKARPGRWPCIHGAVPPCSF